MVAVSLLLWPVAGTTPVYGAAAALLGAGFLREAHLLLRRARAHAEGRVAEAGGASLEATAMRLFHGSITYLTLLFLAVAVDPLLPF
jgi:protoheme IX farnesyltransferase